MGYSPTFLRMLKSLSQELQNEAIEKIDLFRVTDNHLSLKVHKLKGSLKDRYSFSVNYKTRIVFAYVESKRTVYLLAIGDHDVYNR